MTNMENRYLFENLYACSESKDPLSQAGADRVIKARKKKQMWFIQKVREQLERQKFYCPCTSQGQVLS